jgi:hypothetical protein
MPKKISLRWKVVILTDLALCGVIFIILAACYIFFFAFPAYRHAQRENVLEEQLLSTQILRIGKFVRLY